MSVEERNWSGEAFLESGVERWGRAAELARSEQLCVPIWAVCSAALIPVTLVAGWLLADAVQPAAYSPMRQTISVTAGYAGTDRWIMTGALALIGVCYVLTSVGLDGLPTRARLGLLVSGIAGIGVAACPEPAVGATTQHLTFTAIGAVSMALWPALVGQKSPVHVLAGVRVATCTTVLFAALLTWLIAETRDGPHLGAAERISSSIEAGWPVVVALALRRSTAGYSPPNSAGTRREPARRARHWGE